MNLFRNLQIRWKLMLSFWVIIVFSIVLAITAVTTIDYVNNNYQYLLDYPQKKTSLLNDIHEGFAHLRRTGLAAIAFRTDLDSVRIYQTQNDQYYAELLANIAEFKILDSRDTLNTAEDIRNNNEKAENMRAGIASYKEQVIDESLVYIFDGRMDEAVAIHLSAVNYVKEVSGIIEALLAETNEHTYAKLDEIKEHKEQSVIQLTLLSAAIAAFSVIISLVISSALVKPIKKLVGVTEKLAHGNFDLVRPKVSKDETGVLTDHFFTVVDSVNALIQRLNDMAHMHSAGRIDVFIDTGGLEGVYCELAESVNAMVSEYLDMDNKAMSCISEIVDGNFNASIEQFPGDKIFINHAIDNLRAGLVSVSGEVETMIQHAIAGEFTSRIDTGKYKGDWSDIMCGLNEVIDVITKPLDETLSVLQKMSAGEFGSEMTGSYDGAFNVLKTAINTTSSNISGYIHEISSVLNELANNNYDQQIQREYVGEFALIKNSINGIIEKLNNVMSSINMAAEQVAAGAKQLSESSIMLANGTSEQASSVQELHATLSIVTEKSETNTSNSFKARELSDESNKNARAGSTQMKRMLLAMEDIGTASKSIDKIIKTIDDISFQINLLSLNAAVEAARAGIHGKGFNAVAEEVRNLAGKSKIAARETAELIENSNQKVTEGMAIAEETAKSLDTITTAIAEISGIVSEISVASGDQATAISQINEGVSQISEVVQSNAATSEESAAASEQLSAQSDLLRERIQEFKLKSSFRI